MLGFAKSPLTAVLALPLLLTAAARAEDWPPLPESPGRNRIEGNLVRRLFGVAGIVGGEGDDLAVDG